MAFPKVKALSAALALLVSQAASAVGLGEIKLNSALNEPLNAEIELLSVGDLDELELFVNLASRKDFERAGVPRDYFLSGLRFEVDLSGSRPKVIVKSEKPVREPFLDFLVEMQWPSGRLLRNYTLLVDLPVYSDEKAKPKAVESSSSGSSSAKPATAPRPAPAPQPAASSNLEAGGDYQVARGDTLWGIAKRSRPQGASIHQTMVAIHELNPRAFVRGDINLLKSGEILRLPAGSQINSSHSDAVADISQQTQSGALIDAADTPSPSSNDQQSSDGRLKLSAATEDAASAEEDYSVSEYDGSEAGGAGNSERLSNDLTIAQEELLRKDRELEEARERIALLEQQVATNDRIVEIQNSTLGEAQQAQAQNQQAAAEAAQQTQKTAEESAEQVPAEPVAAESEQGFLAQYKYYLMAGIGLLLALLVALGLRRKKDDDADEFTFDEAPEPTFEEPEPAAAIAELNETEPEEQEPEPAALVSEPEPEEEPQEEVVDLSDEDQLFDFEEEDESLEEDEPSDKEQDEELDEILTRFDEADEEAEQDADDDLDFDVELDLDDEPQDEDGETDDSSEEDSAEDEPEAVEEEAADSEDADEADAQQDDEPEEEVAEEATATEEESEPEVVVEDADDDFDLDMEGDEIGTKLDLAKAYSDVGDTDGAREMLEEVIEEGSDEQKAEAKKLLDDLE
ncbi:FimV/HubP family polar landmark protein [Porticoccus sp. W117]|uniref:FimV/HubP family polar landmark protein n=1 Tax=Porticoccus sp. W117 TaxID=3054777 RepID=UPI0025973CA7|nr:FimV/HubP family polar landmark protein [Porticoccus sp. W117]MDM3871666.1 FimV/HubP family polar landmark protein [Porticoccus sp. W117]